MSARRSPSQFIAYFGTATLIAGSAANVEPQCLTVPSRCTIILSRNTPGGTLGYLSAPSMGRSEPDTTFDLLSSSNTDVSTVNWLAIPKNPGLPAALTGSQNAQADGSLRKPPSGLFVAKGTVGLVAGTKTVTTGKQFSSNARVFVMANDLLGTPGRLSAPQASVDAAAGTFVINSTSNTDISSVDWLVVDQPLRFSPSGPRMGQAAGTFVDGNGLRTVDGMNPFNEVTITVLASLTTAAGTQGNLSAPSQFRYPTITNGSVKIDGGNASNTSTFEVLAL